MQKAWKAIYGELNALSTPPVVARCLFPFVPGVDTPRGTGDEDGAGGCEGVLSRVVRGSGGVATHEEGRTGVSDGEAPPPPPVVAGCLFLFVPGVDTPQGTGDEGRVSTGGDLYNLSTTVLSPPHSILELTEEETEVSA